MGDNKEIKVKGKGVVALRTQCGEVKLLHNVQFVPNLAHNLLTVSQLLSSGYSVNFYSAACHTLNKKTGRLLVTVSNIENNMLTLQLTNVKTYGLIMNHEDNTKFWHQRFGHLNMKSLNQLKNKNLVTGMGSIYTLQVCGGCALGKQTLKFF